MGAPREVVPRGGVEDSMFKAMAKDSKKIQCQG